MYRKPFTQGHLKHICGALLISCALTQPAHAASAGSASRDNPNAYQLSGELRAIYMGKSSNGAHGLAAGGFLRLTTPTYNHISGQIALYTTQPILTNAIAKTSLVTSGRKHGFTLLGEANLRYDDETTALIVGNQEVSTPLVTPDDARVIENLFTAAHASTHLNDQLSADLLYIHAMSGLDNGNINKDWVSMSKVLGTTYNAGMFAAGINYKNDNVSLRVWDYDVQRTANLFYVDASYTPDDSPLGLSYDLHAWRGQSHGRYEADRARQRQASTRVNYYFLGARINAQIDAFTLQLAGDLMRKPAGTHTIQAYYGNYPEYTTGTVFGSGLIGMTSTGTANDLTHMQAGKIGVTYAIQPKMKLHSGYILIQSNRPNTTKPSTIWDLMFTANDIDQQPLDFKFEYEHIRADVNEPDMATDNIIRSRLLYHF